MRYFVYSGSLGMTRAIAINKESRKAYFMFRDSCDSHWMHGIQYSTDIPEIPDKEIKEFAKKLAGDPAPIFMEFEGASAKAFGLVRDAEILAKSGC